MDTEDQEDRLAQLDDKSRAIVEQMQKNFNTQHRQILEKARISIQNLRSEYRSYFLTLLSEEIVKKRAKKDG